MTTQDPMDRINEAFSQMDWQHFGEENAKIVTGVSQGLARAFEALLPEFKKVIDILTAVGSMPEVRRYISIRAAQESGRPLVDFDRRLIRRRKRAQEWKKRR